jgi:hypothetical protein
VNSNDLELDSVVRFMQAADPKGRRTARVLRQTLDQLYDGQRTGRYRWDQLHKTEKTHCGTLVEINLHREFGFGDGDILDYKIAGCEVDCKYSQAPNGWMIPPEARDHLCLVVSADDVKNHWSMGLLRVTADRLNPGTNRDGKATLNVSGKLAIYWLFREAMLPENVLLHLDRTEVDRIMALDSGQKRVNEIFRVAQGRLIGRGVIATLAQQEDYMKRVRGNGGARSALRPEGLIILGQYKAHVAIAHALRIAAPGPGESIAVRVTPSSKGDPHAVWIAGGFWRVASDNDPVADAPVLP